VEAHDFRKEKSISMNIFALDLDPKIAARYHCDKHVVKMILETSQILCTVLHQRGIDAPYKPTHRNHPCTIWAGECRENFSWLLSLGINLAREYTNRFRKRHASEAVLDFAMLHTHSLPDGTLTPFAQAMPDEFKHSDPITAYRNYYRVAKADLLTYKYSSTPDFLTI
jgi:hypothetical protein